MGNTNEKPVIVKINRGEIVNSVNSINQKQYNIDLFNGSSESFENYKLLWDAANKKFGYGTFTPKPANLNLNNYFFDDILRLNGDDVTNRMGESLIVGTHVGEQAITNDLIENQHTIKCDRYDVSAKFNFIYVQMTTGVSENFGEEKNRKSSENKYTTASELKQKCAGKVKLGFSHYLTAFPTNGTKTPDEIGRDQARKFLKSIVGSDKDVLTPENLNGGLRPMVIFVDNITQVGYYGAAPIGIKKENENF